MESDDTDAAAASFGEGEIDEVAGEAAAAMIRFDVDVEEIAAGCRTRVKRMRRPVKDEQAGAGDDGSVVLGEPAEVAAAGDGLGDPGFVGLRH
jgi:hypothetical protein